MKKADAGFMVLSRHQQRIEVLIVRTRVLYRDVPDAGL